MLNRHVPFDAAEPLTLPTFGRHTAQGTAPWSSWCLCVVFRFWRLAIYRVPRVHYFYRQLIDFESNRFGAIKNFVFELLHLVPFIKGDQDFACN